MRLRVFPDQPSVALPRWKLANAAARMSRPLIFILLRVFDLGCVGSFDFYEENNLLGIVSCVGSWTLGGPWTSCCVCTSSVYVTITARDHKVHEGSRSTKEAGPRSKSIGRILRMDPHPWFHCQFENSLSFPPRDSIHVQGGQVQYCNKDCATNERSNRVMLV